MTLLILILFIAIAFIAYLSVKEANATTELENLKSRIVKVSDTLPKNNDAQAMALKLSNELSEYFVIDEESNTISITILK